MRSTMRWTARKRIDQTPPKKMTRRNLPPSGLVLARILNLGLSGRYKTLAFRHAFSLTRLRAGAPSRREPWGAGEDHYREKTPRGLLSKGPLREGAPHSGGGARVPSSIMKVYLYAKLVENALYVFLPKRLFYNGINIRAYTTKIRIDLSIRYANYF
jgi:hypothetical protein